MTKFGLLQSQMIYVTTEKNEDSQEVCMMFKMDKGHPKETREPGDEESDS